MKRILITGINGLIGSVLKEALVKNYEIVGLDRTPSRNSNSVVADISDFGAIRPAFDNVDVVIHLAANPNPEASWEEILPSNIIGTYNIFEAARQADVKHIIFASTNRVTYGYEKDEPYSSIIAGKYENLKPGQFPMISEELPVRPDSFYAVSKLFGENLGRSYYEKHNIPVACLRIGSVNKGDKPESIRDFATFFSHRDLTQLVEKCLEANNLSFDIFYGVSNNTWRFWDIQNAQEKLGYSPKDDAEDYR